MVWKSTAFLGQLVFSNNFAIFVELTSKLNNVSWLLTTVYAPCIPNGKRESLNWLETFKMPLEIDWLIIGDFNLIRRPKDRRS